MKQRPPASPVPRLMSLTTAVPSHLLHQADMAAESMRVFDNHRLAPVFAAAGIDTRHGSAPAAWFLQPQPLSERNDLFLACAIDLLAEAVGAALAEAGLEAGDIDAIVVASTTGIATPALDARLMRVLPFRPDVRRAPLFGLGCVAGVIGLARAADLARAYPQERVLLLSVDLCTLAFRAGDRSRTNMAAAAIFGDGAAAAIVSCRDDAFGPALGPNHEHTWPKGPDIMDWDIGGGGLRVLFNRALPDTVRTAFPPLAEAFLASVGLTTRDVSGFALHPGGARVVEAMEAGLGLPDGGLRHTRATLREHGNMSGPTALFVLKAMLDDYAVAGPVLLGALGPGFTAAMMIVHV